MASISSPLAVLALALCTVACEPVGGDAEDDDGDDQSDADTNDTGDAWIEFGQGEEPWFPVEEGDPLLMVLGGQGLLMFPMPLHGQGFSLPDDPTDWTHPDIPILDMHLDVDGFNIGFGDHFFRLANYPIPFTILEDGTYEFVYVTMFVPDELEDPCDIQGVTGQLHAELETIDTELLVWDRDVIIEVPSELCDP